jgi:hypothetical protein
MKIRHPNTAAPGSPAARDHDLDAIKQRGWRDQHILVVNADDERLDFIEREFVRRSASASTAGRRRHG